MKKGISAEGVLIVGVVIVLGILAVGAVTFGKSSLSQKSTNSGNSQIVPSINSNISSASGEKVDLSSGINLKLTTPIDGQTLAKSPVTVKGLTKPGAEVAVNDKEAKADREGNFSVTTDLEDGDNSISVIVNDDQGNFAEKDLVVKYGQQ